MVLSHLSFLALLQLFKSAASTPAHPSTPEQTLLTISRTTLEALDASMSATLSQIGLEAAGTIDVRGRTFPGISNLIADLAPESKKGPCTSLHHFLPETVVLLTFPTGTPPRTWLGDGRRDNRRTAAVNMC